MNRERRYRSGPELLVLSGELEQSVHGSVVCGAEMATVPDIEVWSRATGRNI